MIDGYTVDSGQQPRTRDEGLVRIFRWLIVLAVFSTSSLAALANYDFKKPAAIEFFETRIRPVLVEHCYKCHNSAKRADGGLAVDHRAAMLEGGESGPIVVPGKPGESRLLAILRHEVADLKMPKNGGKLDASVVNDFQKWIEMGTPDPRDQAPTATELIAATSWEALFQKRKTWWSFQPVAKPDVPAVQNSDWSAHPVDRFLLAKQEEKGLTPSSPASRSALLRRISFALSGLPPTPEEVRAFLTDESPRAYEKVVDRLLTSPRFGDRWARHWMDLVRYCESHGSQGDPELANAWRYRDYLVRAFNEDVPYDRLVREQIAGDLLPDPRWNKAEKFNESAIGPAYLRMVELGYIPVDALEDQVKVVDNQIDVVSKTFLGLTVSCSRCHNHKFDPVSQEDYYALYGVLASTRPSEVLIDSPELIEKNRVELVNLKQKIRGKLADAWLQAASKVSERLEEQTRHEQEIAALNSKLDRSREEIASLALPAQAKVLQARGRQVHGCLPVPKSRWSFDRDASDSIGRHHGQLQGGAVVRNGRLVLNGVEAFMTTATLEQDFQEKTFEAWVSLSNTDQRGGGVIGLESLEGGLFDSIVFGEEKPGHWMAGSDFFRRTIEPGGTAETAMPGELIHIAVVYRSDNTIVLYHNGESYGKAYQKGTLQPFLKGAAHFLFGYRLRNAKPPLACEIEEARAYDRPLTAEETAASFRAGPAGVSEQEIVTQLSEIDRKKFAELKSEQSRMNEELSRLRAGSNHGPWAAALKDALANKANPLSLWHGAFKDEGQARSSTVIRESWSKAAQDWQKELASRREFNAENFKTAWDLRTSDAESWFRYGPGLESDATSAGEFSIEAAGERVLKGIYPAGIFSHRVSSKHQATLTSPRFKIETDNVFLRASGQNSIARLVIENYPIGNGGLYPATRPNRDEMGWIRLDTAYRKGAQAYFEFSTNASERAFFGASEILTGTAAELPRELVVPIQSLLEAKPPESLADLASRYGESLRKAILNWKAGMLNDKDAAFLDFFVRRELLPTTINELPQLKEDVERFRALEAEIPLPRKAPGVLETAAFDQALFIRGVHTQPGAPVARRGLSVLGGAKFATAQSGRLELAKQLASPENPLTARVMVNRIWHHLFGRGIVATVDNFGHLGEKPSHPELLDYLAERFIREGWSTKKMIRFLVTSRAYQQNSHASAEAARIDPLNIWLTHMPVKRLEAEAIRDGILAVSGELDTRMYGPGVNVYYVTKTEGGGPKGPLNGDRRRSIYLRIRRNAQNSFLEAFDAPKPSTTHGKRDTTNVPAQSLTMLNDPFVIDQALQWSKHLINEPVEPTERIKSMYLRAIGREPTASEIKNSLVYLNDLLEEHKSAGTEPARQERAWQDLAHALFCLKEFIYVE